MAGTLVGDWRLPVCGCVLKTALRLRLQGHPESSIMQGVGGEVLLG